MSCSAHAASVWLRAGAFRRTQSRYRYGSKWFSFAVSIRLYFWIADMKNTMQRWDEWLRRRFRVYIWKQWKVPSARIRNLIKLGMRNGRPTETETLERATGRLPGAAFLRTQLQAKDSQQPDTLKSETTTSPCTYAIEPPCTERYARWCERSGRLSPSYSISLSTFC